MSDQGIGAVAVVLHAHLPWVRPGSADISFEEAWLYEALWESYVPLYRLAARLTERRRDGERRPFFTLSLSPTLIAMLRDPERVSRFDRYAAGITSRIEGALSTRPDLAPALEDHRVRLDDARAALRELSGDLVQGFAALAEAGAIDLATTAATHALLPATYSEATARAQLRMGLRYFNTVTRRHARLLWLPECAYDERLEDTIASSGATATILDAHAIDLGRPRSRYGVRRPIVSDAPFAFFGRSTVLCDRIWSREHGYPSHADYREFFASLGPSDDALSRPIKPFRVTGRPEKSPYDPARARATAADHAADLLDACGAFLAADLGRSGPGDAGPIATLAFDAELFGHWWWEGPTMLEAFLARADGRDGRPITTTPPRYLELDPVLPVSRPATSTWGRGGYLDVWTHPRSSVATRIAHRAERRVLFIDELVRDTPRTETQRLARLGAIRELFLLMASDYGFMLRTGEFETYAHAMLREHAARVEAFTRVAERATEEPNDRFVIEALTRQRPLFAELEEDAWADAFDAW
ncbi:MAG: 1,4-alpha-glucan branching protein domain-containing protein [Polyangiaceae bacterium]